MQCDYFDAGRCRSCTLMGEPYAAQLAWKQQHCEELLAPFRDIRWLDPVASREAAYRNRAKMVVAGTVDAPTIGILDAEGSGVDLEACGICSPGHRAAFPVVAELVGRARLTPYDVRSRTGELKHLIITESPDGELMVRFVLRSTEPVPRLRKHLDWLRERMPRARVITANVLPEHKAVVEGWHEIVLTDHDTLPMRLNSITMHLRPQSFFQTNTEIGAALYREAQEWAAPLGARSVWDLYCGVGGFALHLAGAASQVVGIETSADAVESAQRSAADAGLTHLRFERADATAWAIAQPTAAHLVVVNPPRRGIGATLAQWLDASPARHVLYSSCHPASLARDLAAMPSLRPVRARVFDMFPQTTHAEVLMLLER